MIPLYGEPFSLTIDDASQVGEARRLAKGLAERQGFNESEISNVAIVATESASNLLKFAPGGELIFRGFDTGDGAGVEFLSVDKGPGMPNVAKCMVDGYSTSGTLGGGLGAIARLSSEFEIYSLPDSGTISMSRMEVIGGADGGDRSAPMVDVGVVSMPFPGEFVCGDSWAVTTGPGPVTTLMVVDGLGHGPQAAEAARAAVNVFVANLPADLERILRLTHEALRHTRGAAMAVARIDHEKSEVQFAGVGNISALILNPGDGRNSNMVSYNGTVGHVIRKIQQFTYPWSRDALLVMHSDGLATRWDLERYPGLIGRHPGLIAGVLYRDLRRGKDDVTVLAVCDKKRGVA